MKPNKFTMISLRMPNALLTRADKVAAKMEKKEPAKNRGYRSQILIRAIARGLPR